MAAMSLVTTIQSEIERAQLNLKDVDENLKKLTGRDFSEPGLRPEQQRRARSSVGSRDEEPPAKRRPQGVFARLGGVVLEQHYQESRGRGRGFRRNSDGIEPRGGDGRGDLRAEIHGGESRGRRVQEVVEEEEKIPKPALASSVARPQVDFKSRTEAAAELTKDRASRDRNRRMFGALIGTLKRFKNDEAKQKDKEEQRAAIDRKLEEKGRVEKEELRRERLELFNQRKAKQAQIRQLTYKMERVKEHEAWEAHMMMLTKFIRTKSSPRLFWLPKSQTSKTTSLVRATRETIMRELEQDRQQLKDDIEGILGSRGDDDQGDEGRGDEDEEEEEEYMSRGVRSEVVRQREGGSNDPLDNCADMLDYEAEEGELVFDEADLSGKDNNDTERVVVQVDGRLDGGRKVEIVGSQALDKTKIMGGNDSEKENQSRHRDKDKGGKDKDKERSSDKDRDRDRGRKHRDKGREKERALDRDREKDKEKEKNSDRERSRDRHSGRDRDRDKKKDRSRDKHRESEKKKNKPAAMEVDEPHLPDLEATIVHIKIEKEEDEFVGKDADVPLKSVKQEKEKSSKGNSSTAVQDDKTTNAGGETQPDGELPPSPTIADFPLPSDSPSPPRTLTKSPPTVIPADSIPLIPSPKQPALPSLPPVPPSSSPPIPTSPPLPPEPSSSTSPSHTPTVPASEEQQTTVGSSRDTGDMLDTEMKKKEDTSLVNMNINPGDIQLPESTLVKPVASSDSKKPPKQKPVKEDKKVSGKKDDRKKREKKKRSSSKHSGSSDNSSDDSSSSSSDSSDSDSTDSGSSSSSSDSSSGSSSDSESDSSSSSSSDSESERKKKTKQKSKKRRGSRSDSESSSGSDGESSDKIKKKKNYSDGKPTGSKKKDEKLKVKPEPHSDEDKSKKRRSDKSNESKDRSGGKNREKESTYKSKDKDRDRDATKRQERDRERGKARAGRSKSHEKKRDRSKSRDRSSRRDRSRSRDTSRKDRKERR